uniref:TNFR-Cys domain-containing protein n=1 Tax=Latimeria chalumnae TaxID=7897 RepID=H3BI17_LATCH
VYNFYGGLHVVLILWVAVCELELKVAASCTLGEYQIKNGDCCPLCPPGSRVYRYCTPEFGTVCIPCMKGTYMDHPNGLLMCLPCSVCDPELGLSVDQECTYTKNTQCSCQKGYHCIDSQKGCKKMIYHPSCALGEYWSKNGNCCPLCPPGSRVYRHCTPESTTTCIPCTNGTYLAHPNKLLKCLRCDICDPDMGLSIDQECTYTKNTQCSCKKGYYCVGLRGNGCGACRKHTICKPGEKVKVEGSDRGDTVCERCPDGTFSETEMSQTCSPWTK